jgi:RNA polymerase primary sigma factor
MRPRTQFTSFMHPSLNSKKSIHSARSSDGARPNDRNAPVLVALHEPEPERDREVHDIHCREPRAISATKANHRGEEVGFSPSTAAEPALRPLSAPVLGETRFSRPSGDWDHAARDRDWDDVGHGDVLEKETALEICRRHEEGETVQSLATQFACSRSRILRILARTRYQRVLELPLDYIPNEMFRRVRSKQAAAIMGPVASTGPAKKIQCPKGLPPYLAAMYEVPLLTREEEVHLFRKLNYLKYKAAKLRDQLDPQRPRVATMREIERLYDESMATKNALVRANLRLVVSIAKRHAHGLDTLFETVSDGNMSLIRAVEKFDFGRGFRFSTYASWAIIKNFARTLPIEQRHHSRFHTSQGEMLQSAKDIRADSYADELAQAEREREVGKVLEHLDEREQQIIRYRYGLGQGHKPMTLKEVGALMGVTKERIRQLETRAMAKLRAAAEEENLPIPEAM